MIKSIWYRLKKTGHYLTTGSRRYVLITSFIVITIGVIINLIWVNKDLFRTYITQMRPIWLLYAIVFFFVDFGFALWVWHLMVSKIAGFNDLRLNTKFCLQSNLARRIPGTVWYVASRAILYEEVGVNKKTTSILSALELAFFMVSGLIMTIITLPFWFNVENTNIKQLDQMWVFLLLPLGILLVHPKILTSILEKLSKQSLPQQLVWQDTIKWLAFFLLTWLTGGLVLFCSINLFLPLSVNYLLITLGIWALSNTISLLGFVTFSFFGLREVSLALLLTQILPTPITILIAIVIRLIWLSGELITSLLSFRIKFHKKPMLSKNR